MQKGTVNLTTGNVRKTMVAFAMPLFLSQLFQQLYNAVDSLIVGNILGKEALASVSSSASLIQLLSSLMIGIALGAGVVISRYFGAGEDKLVSDSIHTTVAFGLVAGAIMTTIGVGLSPVLLRWMNTPEDVLEGSIAYFRYYFMGAIPVMLYNVFTGILNALGDSKRPLYYLILSSILNVVLDLLFIGVFHYGVGSAAVATAISQGVSALLCFLYLHKPGTIYQVRIHKIKFHGHLLREVVRMGLPTGIQNSVIAIANVAVQGNINSFGADATAACGVYNRLQGFAFLPITSYAMALTTFVSQNLGAKQYDRARKGARFGILTMVTMAELIGIFLAFASPLLVRLFNNDPDVIAIAVRQSRIENFFFCLLAFSHAIAGVCRGAGRSTVPMTVMLSVWCLFRIVYITVAMSIRHDIRLLFIAYPLTWIISSIIFFIYYKKSDWVHGFEAASHRGLHWPHRS